MKKTCNKCKQEKELAEFHRDKQKKDELRTPCKVCVNAGVAAYSKANPDKEKARKAAWRKANPEQVKAKNDAWSKANPEKVKAKHAAYSKANPEKMKARVAAWSKANPEKIKAKNAAYRAYKKEIKQLQEEAGFETT